MYLHLNNISTLISTRRRHDLVDAQKKNLLIGMF